MLKALLGVGYLTLIITSVLSGVPGFGRNLGNGGVLFLIICGRGQILARIGKCTTRPRLTLGLLNALVAR